MSQQSESTTATSYLSSVFGKDRKTHLPGELGIWILIIGDLTLYCVLFLTFMGERSKHVDLFNEAAATATHPTVGGINMLLLLFSSLTVAIGVKAVREQIAEKRAPVLFALAFLCGLMFVLNKVYEYSSMVIAGATPVANLFLSWYYVLTGLHLLHLLGGMGCLIFMYRLTKKIDRGPNDVRNMENAATFWHAVDLLWVVLFPLLYLMR